MRRVPTLSYHRSLRLKGYDYTQPGAYFVTICTSERRCLLGAIVDGDVRLSPAGCMAQAVWNDLPQRFPGIGLDAHVIMPSHLHGILMFHDKTMDDSTVMNEPVTALGDVVRAFKAAACRAIRVSDTPDFQWQRNFYEHVIRSEAELDRIRRYIVENPLRWELDHENPHALAREWNAR